MVYNNKMFPIEHITQIKNKLSRGLNTDLFGKHALSPKIEFIQLVLVLL